MKKNLLPFLLTLILLSVLPGTAALTAENDTSEIVPATDRARIEQACLNLVDSAAWIRDMPSEFSFDFFPEESVLELYLYDIDKNGVDELIITYGCCLDFCYHGFYAFKDGDPEYLGNYVASPDPPFGREGDTGIGFFGYGTGEWWSYYVDIYQDELCVLYEDSISYGIDTRGPVYAFPENHWHTGDWTEIPVFMTYLPGEFPAAG